MEQSNKKHYEALRCDIVAFETEVFCGNSAEKTVAWDSAKWSNGDFGFLDSDE